jgi:membrane protease YdiL (CAAX protease family)
LVLFLPSLASEIPEIISFSTNQELNRLFGYTIPSLLLVWYIMYIRREVGARFPRVLRLKFDDIVSFLLALPGLLAVGFSLSIFSSAVSRVPAAPTVEAPQGPLQWLVMFLSCIGTGYLEESYFRCYLITRFRETKKSATAGIILSMLLFSFCHFYEGFWGVINALLAGFLLSLIFRRYSALHGIAWAHGLYNAFIYATGISAG